MTPVRHGAGARWRGVVALWLATSAGAADAATCSATTTPVAFGSYDVYSALNVNSTGSVAVTCATQASDPSGNFAIAYEVELGSGGSGSTALRQMRGVSTGERLNYNLYRNNARSQLWGDGVTAGSVNASFTLNKLTAPSRTRTHTVFGRIPPLQDVAVDGYGDNVLVTINY